MSFRETFSTDIPFARDDAHRLLPAMIACLAGFAALLLTIAMTLTGTLSAQSKHVTGIVQVEIPYVKAEKTLIDDVVMALNVTAGVQKVTVLAQKDMEALLKPWLGDEFTLDTLPVPVLIDVKTSVRDNKTEVDLLALRARLAKIDKGIKVEDRGPWVAHMVKAVTVLQALVLLVACLLLACVMGMIVLVAKTNLKLHFKTVSLLHMFGATDEYILRQFQWNSALLAGRGALIGVGVSAAVFFVVVFVSHRWASPVLPILSVSISHLIVFVALPAFTALTALLATRLTVQSMLHHMH